MKEGDLLEWLRAVVLWIPQRLPAKGIPRIQYLVQEVRRVGWSSVYARIWKKYSLMPGRNELAARWAPAGPCFSFGSWCCVGDWFFSLTGTSTMESGIILHILWPLKQMGMANLSCVSEYVNQIPHAEVTDQVQGSESSQARGRV